MAVNVSPRQLDDPEFISIVQSSLASSGLKPGQLLLEITESVVLGDVPRAIKTLEDLGRIGVRLTIDDFGTGYSSLTYLSQLPVHILKIDRAFVGGLGPGRGNDKLVTTILSMAESLGMQVIAEGAELPVQIERLDQLGCTWIQGYYFTEPGPLDSDLFAFEQHMRA